MRSQIYEFTQTTINNMTQPTSIFVGGTGNNITKPAETTATQFVVLEDIACTPGNATNDGGALQVRINTTDYFQNPDVTKMSGVEGTASPYPRGLSDGTNNLIKSFDLYPDVYVLPGQVWDVLYTQGSDLPTSGAAGTIINAFVKYTLYDGPDALIANKLLELGITVNPANVDWYKRTLIEQQSGMGMGA